MSKVHNTDSPADFGVSTTFHLSPTENADQRFPSLGIEKAPTAQTSLHSDLSNEVWQSISTNSLDHNERLKGIQHSIETTPEIKSVLDGFELVAYANDGSGQADQATGSASDKTPPADVFATPEERKADSKLEGQPPQEIDPRFEALKKRIAAADQIDPRLAINDVLAGQIHSVDFLETLTRKEIATKENKPLLETSERIDQQKFNSYVAYLSPATTRADLALARITTGNAEQVKQGEKELIEALRLRPELQFNAELQNAIEAAFKIMAESRQKAGLPPLGTTNSVVYSSESGTNTKPGTGNGTDASTRSGIVDSTAAYEKLSRASQTFQQKGIGAAAPLFQQAIGESDKLDQRAMTEQRLQLFARKLELTRQIAETTAQGKNTDSLQGLHKKVAEREWESYKNYLSPASIRTNTAMAMIASGDEKQLVEAKKLLAESIRLRPELEFSKEYKEHLKKAFEAHHQNRPSSNSDEVTGNGLPDNKAIAEKQIDVKPGYKPFDAEKKTTPVSEIANEPEMERYLSDRLTGPVLTAGLLYLGYRTVKSQYNRRIERARVARLSDLLRVPDGETGSENKSTETENKTSQNKTAENQTADRTGENKTAPNRTSENRPVENGTSNEPVRPRRRIVERENLGREGIEIAQDGTRTFTGAQGELMKLSWKERLTDTEMQELEKTRKELERRVEKGDKLSKDELKQLDALNHFEKNKFDAKLHKKIVESVEKSRPEGGFRARDAVGPVIGISIITSAIIGYYLNSRGEAVEEPLKRAKFEK